MSEELRLRAEPNEAECLVCGPWAPEDRPKIRASLVVIPLDPDLVCEACLKARWASLPWDSWG